MLNNEIRTKEPLTPFWTFGLNYLWSLGTGAVRGKRGVLVRTAKDTGRRHWFAVCFAISGHLVLTSCTPSISAGPERLTTTAEEMNQLRKQTKLPDFEAFGLLDPQAQILKRNAYISQRMYGIDIAYSSYEASLTQERQTVGFGATSAAMGLSAAAGLFSPTTTKNVLAGLSTGVLGAKAVYSDEVLAKQTIQVLQTQMRTNRARVASMILVRMRLDATAYPLSAALSDIETYYQAGTITGGLLGVTSTVAAEASQVEESNEIIQSILANKAGYYDEAAIRIYAYYHPGGKISRERQAYLRELLKKNGFPDLAEFLTSETMRDARRKIAGNL